MNSTGSTPPPGFGDLLQDELLAVSPDDLLPGRGSPQETPPPLGEEFEIEGSVDPDQIPEVKTPEAPPSAASDPLPVSLEPDPVVTETAPLSIQAALQISPEDFLSLHRGPDPLQILDKRLEVLRLRRSLPAEALPEAAFPFDF